MSEKPNAEEVARVRARGREILASLKDDPGFVEEVRKDPTAALVSRGIPEAAAQEWQQGGDVQGYSAPNCAYSCTNTDDIGGCGYGTVYY